MKILLIAATTFEINPLLQYLEKNFRRTESVFESEDLSVRVLQTGAGMLATGVHLSHHLSISNYDLVVNAGVAGSYDPQLPPGTVVNVVSEILGDLGVENADGSFGHLSELPWSDQPLEMRQTTSAYKFLPAARGITVNRVHGSARSIARVRQTFPNVQIESMEGGAVFYVCQRFEQHFLEIRAVSNWVEPRNRDNWQMDLAIQNLNDVLRELIQSFK